MNSESNKITIKNAAEQLNVSVVSIHNWIKDGSLQTTNNILTQKNIDDFRDNFLNSKKLSLFWIFSSYSLVSASS